MRALLAGVAPIEVLGLLTLGMYLYPWRRLEIVTLGLLMLATALIFLRQFRAWRSNTGWFVLATGGAVAIVWTIPVDSPLGSPVRDSAASKVP